MDEVRVLQARISALREVLYQLVESDESGDEVKRVNQELEHLIVLRTKQLLQMKKP
ncbi:MAG: hypothetical protein AB1497_07010 [Bacillota bacterium]